jgi:hypothetical protein
MNNNSFMIHCNNNTIHLDDEIHCGHCYVGFTPEQVVYYIADKYI